MLAPTTALLATVTRMLPRRGTVEHLSLIADSELGQDPVYRYLSPKSWNPSGRTVGPG